MRSLLAFYYAKVGMIETNASEFTSQAFNDYCMSIGVSVEYSVAHVHTQNGLAESFIK